ncbi:hypothetical protein SGRI78S_02176 [Streptomyces griseus subsp. griseus]
MSRIAIVGVSCSYPDATTPRELWENAVAGRRAFRRLPDVRMRLDDYYDPDPAVPDKFYARNAAVLEGWEFDRVAHRIAGGTYRSTDLTHWLALDTATRALADAGFPAGEGLPRERTGVVVGNTLTGEFARANVMRLRWPYVRRVLADALKGQDWGDERLGAFLEGVEDAYKQPFPAIDEDTLAGGLSNTIAGRICNHFDLNGGGYTVDGACSSSLLSVTTASASLLNGDLDVAVAGGVDMSIDPFEIIGFAKTGALARTEMRLYDRGSNGFWPGEGCGMVVLMREEDALAAGHRVYASIAGWGISSDGQGGITRPEVSGYQLALARAYERAGFGIDTVPLFEGHGTGTAVGDATELQGDHGRPRPGRPARPQRRHQLRQGHDRPHQGRRRNRRTDQGHDGPGRRDAAARHRLRRSARAAHRGVGQPAGAAPGRGLAERGTAARRDHRHGVRRDQHPCRPRQGSADGTPDPQPTVHHPGQLAPGRRTPPPGRRVTAGAQGTPLPGRRLRRHGLLRPARRPGRHPPARTARTPPSGGRRRHLAGGRRSAAATAGPGAEHGREYHALPRRTCLHRPGEGRRPHRLPLPGAGLGHLDRRGCARPPLHRGRRRVPAGRTAHHGRHGRHRRGPAPHRDRLHRRAARPGRARHRGRHRRRPQPGRTLRPALGGGPGLHHPAGGRPGPGCRHGRAQRLGHHGLAGRHTRGGRGAHRGPARRRLGLQRAPADRRRRNRRGHRHRQRTGRASRCLLHRPRGLARVPLAPRRSGRRRLRRLARRRAPGRGGPPGRLHRHRRRSGERHRPVEAAAAADHRPGAVHPGGPGGRPRRRPVRRGRPRSGAHRHGGGHRRRTGRRPQHRRRVPARTAPGRRRRLCPGRPAHPRTAVQRPADPAAGGRRRVQLPGQSLRTGTRRRPARHARPPGGGLRRRRHRTGRRLGR